MQQANNEASHRASTGPQTGSKEPRDSGTISIARALVMSFGGLIVVALSIVLAVTLWAGRQNTLDHLTDQAELNISSLVAHISQQLKPVEQQLSYLGNLIARDRISTADSRRLVDILTGALAATPQIQSVAFIDSDLRAIGATRGANRNVFALQAADTNDPSLRAAVGVSRTATNMIWGTPAWQSKSRQALLPLHQPVRRDGAFVGVLVAWISIDKLSDLLADLKARSGTAAFILYDQQYVLADPTSSRSNPEMPKAASLPTIMGIGDPVLASMWKSRPHQHFETKRFEGHGHLSKIQDKPFLFMHRELADYGEKPWTLVTYLHAADFATDMLRLKWSAIAGVAVLVLSAAAAVVLGQRMARPIARLAGAAKLVGELDIATVSRLPGSRFQEINEAARAFNAMLRGLRWFEIYVPKALVARLMARDDGRGPDSTECQVTVMFTDIAGFTKFSETIPAAEIAEFLNRHFELIAKCVEATGGTVDKYLGDGVMAFWGAPEGQPDHAERACKAARAIAIALKEDNEARRREGKPPVRVRIGAHTGEVVVGNIGAAGRINYTIVGDTVNTASRLEQLCKEVCADRPEAVALISEVTAADLDPSFLPTSLGEHHLRGRHETLTVYRLL